MSDQPTNTFVNIHQCRFCGSIVPFPEGIERHQSGCRFPGKILDPKFKQMVIVKFPCPHVQVTRLSPEEVPNDLNVNRNETHRQPFETPTISYTCPLSGCGTVLKTAQLLKYHFILHLKNNPYPCKVPGCNVKCDTPGHLRRHMEAHSGTTFPCEKCGLSFTRKNKEHQCRESGTQNLQVRKKRVQVVPQSELQPQSLEREDDVANVVKKRNDVKAIISTDPIFLKACQDNPDFKDLILGRRAKNSDIDKPFKCNKCGKLTISEKVLKEHHSKFHSHRPWKCSKCGQTFKTKSFLISHMKTHELAGGNIYIIRKENGLWECTECGAESTFEESLRRHWFLVHKIRIPRIRELLTKDKAKTSKSDNKSKSKSRGKRKSKTTRTLKSHEAESESDSNSSSDDDIQIEPGTMDIPIKKEFMLPTLHTSIIKIEPQPELPTIAPNIKIEQKVEPLLEIDDSNEDCVTHHFVKQEVSNVP